jgi:hypothetical protein
VPWEGDDWRHWWGEERARESHRAPHLEALQRILVRFPDRHALVAAHLERTSPGIAPFLDDHFRRVVRIGSLPRGLTRFRGSFHVVVAVDVLAGAGATSLPFVHAALTEGGILVGTVPASAPGADPCELRLELPELPQRLHEVELQYYLSRAGFQGLRIRRIPADLCFAERMLFMGARRALN